MRTVSWQIETEVAAFRYLHLNYVCVHTKVFHNHELIFALAFRLGGRVTMTNALAGAGAPLKNKASF